VAPPAPKVVNGLIAGFPNDVPARDLHRRHGAHMNLGAEGIDIPHHLLRDGFDLKRVHPEHERFQFMDRGFHRLSESV
jgi:hypothetical protein